MVEEGKFTTDTLRGGAYPWKEHGISPKRDRKSLFFG